MKKEVLKEPIFAEKILRIIRSSPSMEEMREQLRDYHDNDIAQSLKYLNRAERNLLYSALDAEWLAEIISYIDDPVEYVDEIGIDKLSAIINEMDADDAVDLWENIDESVKVKLRPMIDDQTKAAILLINSYDDDEVGSLITTNYICIHQSLTIRQAMHELVRQAGENDNIATIYVVDGRNRFCGAIDLKDLIVARENVPLDSLISYAYPYLLDHEKISDSIEKIKDYAEDSLPVLNRDKKIIGIITAQDVVEAVDDELGEDYAMLAGLSAEEDLNETIAESIKKRLPWLIILLFLGMGVSTVVGAFEGVVAVLPVVICFQSLILDMAGNVGTAVSGGHDPRADGRKSEREGQAASGREGDEGRLLQRRAARRDGARFSGCLHRAVQGLFCRKCVSDLGLRRSLAPRRHCHFQSGRHARSDAVP